MPGAHGGDQLDEDYSPGMYINHQFVGSKQKEVTHGRWTYCVGVSQNGVIAERWLTKGGADAKSNPKPVPKTMIPAKVRNAVSEHITPEILAKDENAHAKEEIAKKYTKLKKQQGLLTDKKHDLEEKIRKLNERIEALQKQCSHEYDAGKSRGIGYGMRAWVRTCLYCGHEE